jgi:uncharacterized LabA/DUF88 family protein
MSLPVVLDTFNLYYAVKTKYQKTIDYSKLIDCIKQEHGDDLSLNAYVLRNKSSGKFAQLLSSLGCFITQKEMPKFGNFDVEVTIHMLTEGCPKMILASNSCNLVPTLRRLHEARMQTFVYGVNFPHEYGNYATLRYITPDHLMVREKDDAASVPAE